MEWIVVLHVLSALLGLGPAYAFPLLLRHTDSAADMERALVTVTRLEIFPKLFGTLALVSGLVLFFLGSYGPFSQIWIVGSLLVYALIEAIIIGQLNPAAKKLRWILEQKAPGTGDVPPPGAPALFAKVRALHAWACALSVILIVLMVLKPQ
ncbi:hypothetical protein J19TS2_14880 [Cohnella xylanilytica]|uniref:DUF2269 family protein n=1 Tax=Cohnella xylanilytica TaxID=557555 RepID=A0A841U227_9BACL|nr:DUF2269 family protein [Cohnella xylanilytica]MBB6692171.1 DUF2269 family protein [Cohnella xylanilytica]GIO11933.1 hypothetical protein J19TS2_14880 [Cohnella xylanilytica]